MTHYVLITALVASLGLILVAKLFKSSASDSYNYRRVRELEKLSEQEV